MTGPGHSLTGIAAGLLLAGLARHFAPLADAPAHLAVTIIVSAAWFGSVAPDRLEFPARVAGRRRSLLPHRTITHWWLPWAALGGFALWAVPMHPLPGWAALGASFSALVHVLCDWPNPMGVPGWLPWRRRSLRLWPSGAHEFEIVAFAFALAAIPWLFPVL